MADLDSPLSSAVDRSDMLRHIQSVGPQFVRAWERSANMLLPAGAEGATSVVVAGMGGSATAADYFAAICTPVSAVPVVVVRGYTLPHFVSTRTLVVVLSYSGGTAEALACYDDARARGAMLAVITRGGQLAARATADRVPAHPIEYESAPRAATVHSLAPLLRLGGRLGLCVIDTDSVREAAAGHEALIARELLPSVPTERNGAKRLARALVGRLPFVLGAEHLAVAATRMRNQLAENGKVLGAAESLPEASHNLVVGLETAERTAANVALVTLESDGLYDGRVAGRFDGVCKLFEGTGIPVFRLPVEGLTILAQLLQATAWGDFVSYYLALANGIDPTPIPQIDRLKLALAEGPE